MSTFWRWFARVATVVATLSAVGSMADGEWGWAPVRIVIVLMWAAIGFLPDRPDRLEQDIQDAGRWLTLSVAYAVLEIFYYDPTWDNRIFIFIWGAAVAFWCVTLTLSVAALQQRRHQEEFARYVAHRLKAELWRHFTGLWPDPDPKDRQG